MQQEKIWDYFQGEGVGSFDGNATRLKFLVRRLLPADKRVLNIGVGNGYLEKTLRSESHAEVYSLDPSEAAIARLRSAAGMDADHAKVGYSQAMPFPDGSFDVVIMSEVIEHLDEAVIAETFREVSRVLDDHGRYLGTVPADERLEDSQVACPNCGEVFHRWGHVQSFSRERLSHLLGRDFDKVIVRRVYFGSWHTLNWKGRAKWLVKKSLQFAGAGGGGENLYFEAARRPSR
jgi:ubiquinone/menaquinone biosynthesis C-methylase UbiE